MPIPVGAIRAVYDRDTITVYQAYRPAIAEAALAAGKFVPPWSTGRMTWIKPSFLWMMERANWARKTGQEYILGVRITRIGFEEALLQGILSHPEADLYRDWRAEMTASPVRIQWGPERTLEGAKLSYRSLQVGLGRPICEDYNEKWLLEISDVTPLVRQIRDLRDRGEKARARDLLPRERVYPVSAEIEKRLGMKRS